MTNGVVVFDYTAWLAEYPEFGAVGSTQAQAFFNRVTVGPVDNTACSPIPYDPTQVPPIIDRVILLNMAVAHMAYLFGPQPDGSQPRGIVGRIDQATEGSVSVHAVYTIPTGDLQAWWNSSPYGAMFYASTLRYRTAVYFPPPLFPGTGGLGYFGRNYRRF